MSLLQQNPKFVPEVETRMKCEAPAGKDPYEELERILHEVANELPNVQVS